MNPALPIEICPTRVRQRRLTVIRTQIVLRISTCVQYWLPNSVGSEKRKTTRR
jgi:hypothetical protein